MRSIGVWIFGFSIFSTQLFSQCNLGNLSEALVSEERQKIFVDQYFLVHYMPPGSAAGQPASKHYRMRIGVLDGNLIITMIEETMGSALVAVPQGVLTIKPNADGSPVRLNFSDFHAGLWNLRPTPTWTEADQTPFQIPSRKAWEFLEWLGPSRSAPAGFLLTLTESNQDRSVESWLEVPQNLPYRVRIDTYHFSGLLTVRVFQSGNDLELATVKISSNWRGPGALDEFARALKKRGVSRDHVEELMSIISAAVRIPL